MRSWLLELMRESLAIVLCSLFVVTLSGCVSGEKRETLDEEFARMTEDERVRVCTNFYRDAKNYCREGLQNESASRSFECLSARMKIDRYCPTPR